MSAEPLQAFSAYGIELEYMLVDRTSLNVRPIADRILLPPEEPPPQIDCSNELVLHVIEIKNPRPGALQNLTAGFQHQVQQFNERLANFDARLMPTAMHPWMNPARETVLWPHQDHETYATFDRLFDCKRHPWANVQSMHINLPFADDQQFEKLATAVRMLLPILPAIGASSPLADGEFKGYLDYRMHVYRDQSPTHPTISGAVIPDIVKSRSEHESRVLAPMYASIEAHDPLQSLRHEWLNSRGAIPRFDRHAIEIRVMDAQECPQADIALAALVIDLAQLLYQGERVSLPIQQALPTAMLNNVLTACTRDAEQAVIDDATYLSAWGYPGEICTARALWQYLGNTLLNHPPCHATLWEAHLQLVLQHGPLARRIVRALDGDLSRSGMHAVYAQLCEGLNEGKFFMV